MTKDVSQPEFQRLLLEFLDEHKCYLAPAFITDEGELTDADIYHWNGCHYISLDDAFSELTTSKEENLNKEEEK